MARSGSLSAPIVARCTACGALVGEPARGRGELIEQADAGDPAALAALDGIRAAVLGAHRCAPVLADWR